MQTIEVAVAIEKGVIAACGKLKGCVNARALSLGEGAIHVAGSLLFEGFVGAIDLSDGLYHGVYTFTASDDHEDPKLADFSELLGFDKSSEATPACDEEWTQSDTTGTHSGDE